MRKYEVAEVMACGGILLRGVLFSVEIQEIQILLEAGESKLLISHNIVTPHGVPASYKHLRKAEMKGEWNVVEALHGHHVGPSICGKGHTSR